MKTYELAPELTQAYIAAVWQTLPHSVRPALIFNSPQLSARLGCDLTIASETFQYTGNFKFRAAYNLLSRTAATDIITASSGNLGQAVAYVCRLLGKKCTVIMSQTAARVKIEAVQAHGGIVDLIDIRQISKLARGRQYLDDHPQSFWVPGHDDYQIVTGSSTLGKEIFEAGNFDVVLAAIGGGGLASGIVIARDYMEVTTEVIGVEPLTANDAARSFRSGQLISNEQEPETIADGARVLGLGKLNWEILRQGLTDIIEVPDALTIKALQAYFLHANLKVEPTGALTLGAVLTQPERFAGKKVCCIVSGGNVDPAVYCQALQSTESAIP
jgi:threonine dehydratase